MTELYPSDGELNALSGTTDGEQEVLFVTTGESPYYTSFYKMLSRLLKVARRAGDLRVYKDGDLTFGVRSGRFFNGDTTVDYSGAAAQALTNNATNYIYLTAAGALTVNTTGFPVPSVTPHIPLATIVTAAGSYDFDDMTDYRGRAIFGVCRGSANLNTLDWQESLADELDFTTSEPASPSDGDRYLNTATGDSSETGQSVTADYIYQWNGTSWTEIQPTEGAAAIVEDRDMLIGFNGTSWVDIGTFGLLNEAQTFFGATDISGAEAETLTDGSVADSLHVHDTAGIANDAVDKTKIAADVAGDGLQQAGDGALAVDASDFAGSGLEDDGSENLRIAAGGVTDAMLASKLAKRPAIKAWGAVYFTGRPADDELLTINGRKYETDDDGDFPQSGGDVQCDLQSNSSVDEDITDIAAAINSDGSAEVDAVADTTNDVLWLQAKTAGAAANSLTLVTGLTNTTVNDSTLADGADAAVAVVVPIRHTITAPEATAGRIRIDTGLTSIQFVNVMLHKSWGDMGGSMTTAKVTGSVIEISENAAWTATDNLEILVIGTA